MSDEVLDLRHENERLCAALRSVADQSECEFSRITARLALAALPTRQAWISWRLRELEIKVAQADIMNEHLTEGLATAITMIRHVRDKVLSADDAWNLVDQHIGPHIAIEEPGE